MRTYDTMITGIIIWIISIFGYYFLPELYPQIFTLNQVYVALGFLFCFILILFLTGYYFLIKKEQKLINQSLLNLKNEGVTLFQKKYEKLLYSRDIADIPVISKFLINFSCLAISQPENIEELKKIIQFCEKFKIQLIPRGAGTSGYGGAIALKKGVVVDMTRINQVIFLDKDNLKVEVESGATWDNLRGFLNSNGFDLKCYPSSAPSSTIGGWINQGGYGIGSSKFGSVVESVGSIIILGTNGKEFRFDDSSFMIGSCGTLGVTWKITLKIQPKRKLFHFSLTSENQNNLLDALNEFQKLSPFFLRYIDHQNVVLKNITNKIDWNSREYRGGIISISFQEEDLDRDVINSISNRNNLTFLPDDLAIYLWKKRYYTLRMKRHGPSLVIAEVLLPPMKLKEFMAKISRKFIHSKYSSEVYTTKDPFVVVFIWFLDDIRKNYVPLIGSVSYTFHWFRSFEIIRIAKRMKGNPYSTGLWLSPYVNMLYKNTIKRIKDVKKEVDPHKIFNKHKFFGFRFPRFFPVFSWNWVVRISIPILSLFYGIIPKKLR